MSTFTLTIKTDNAAFHEGADDGEDQGPSREVARLLRMAAARIEDGETSVTLLDYNGNTVGEARFEEED